MNKILIGLFFMSMVLPGMAQNTGRPLSTRDQKRDERRKHINELARKAEEGTLVYNKQSVFGLQFRTNGLGVFYELGRMKTNERTSLYRLDIAEIKHPKEEKQSGGALFGNSYVYGKINNFYNVNVGYGEQRMLGQKGNKNGVAVSALYMAGLSLGLLRPYYVNVYDPVNRTNLDIKYNSADSAKFLNQSYIVSSSGISIGWRELQVKPGVFAKAALRFDYDRFNETLKALEVGLSINAFASKIPQLIYQKENRIFVQGHIAFCFGKRK